MWHHMHRVSSMPMAEQFRQCQVALLVAALWFPSATMSLLVICRMFGQNGLSRP